MRKFWVIRSSNDQDDSNIFRITLNFIFKNEFGKEQFGFNTNCCILKSFSFLLPFGLRLPLLLPRPNPEISNGALWSGPGLAGHCWVRCLLRRIVEHLALAGRGTLQMEVKRYN